MTTYERLTAIRRERGTGYFILLDPDKLDGAKLPRFIESAEEAGVDGFLVGGSLMFSTQFDALIQNVKQHTKLPVVIFPGSLFQVSPAADAILFLLLISGRNADQIIGNQVVAAPIIRKIGLEAISTGYMLIESGRLTSAGYMSQSLPIPRAKTDIAVAHAVAAEMIGLKMLYLDAGSGADLSIPEEMIAGIAKYCSLLFFIGGGIRTPEEARNKVLAGAPFIVTGTIIEENAHGSLLKEFAEAIHAPHTASTRTV